MIPDTSSKALDKIRKAANLRLFLDYDGTLADFAPTPDEVYPDPELLQLLKKLIDQPGIQVAVISGRRLEHVRKLIPLEGILLAGTYGIEIQDPMGKQLNRVSYDQIRPSLDILKPQWLELIHPQPQIYLEDKGWSLALHAKNLDLDKAVEILDQAQNLVNQANFPPGIFRVFGGHKFLEFAPRLANKGTTIRYLLTAYPLEGDLPVYIGDDDKDEEAYDVIVENSGVAIKVGSTHSDTLAQVCLESPRAVREFLQALLQNEGQGEAGNRVAG